jgi:hypothetical protein
VNTRADRVELLPELHGSIDVPIRYASARKRFDPRFDPVIVPIAHHTQVRENKQSMETTVS